ncbi:MAG: hypothetical protein Fur0046_25700 [Cyanobacteria bacterium J069]|nr:MAG: hypothetical protein D6742_16525 [Cyanobacteria bacterium J069]
MLVIQARTSYLLVLQIMKQHRFNLRMTPAVNKVKNMDLLHLRWLKRGNDSLAIYAGNLTIAL